MNSSSAALCKASVCGAVLASLFAGCVKNDPISQAAKMDASRPGVAETKAIAEEGFIYGVPIVMNYAVMYEYAVDRNSGQFKAPFNQIKTEPPSIPAARQRYVAAPGHRRREVTPGARCDMRMASQWPNARPPG
jgi:hypothetical protein